MGKRIHIGGYAEVMSLNIEDILIHQVFFSPIFAKLELLNQESLTQGFFPIFAKLNLIYTQQMSKLKDFSLKFKMSFS